MPTEEKYKWYLGDLGHWIRERALEESKVERAPPGSAEHAFREGLRMGYYVVISHMQGHSEAFGIPLAELCLDELNPERDVL